MNRDDIIRMAREACGEPAWSGGVEWTWEELERFANLVAAAERERIKWDTIHSCHPHCDRPACVAVRRAREDEREACAQIVHDTYEGFGVDAQGVDFVKQRIMETIRARGQG